MRTEFNEIKINPQIAADTTAKATAAKEQEAVKRIVLFKSDEELKNTDELNINNPPSADRNKINEYYARIEKSCSRVGISIERVKNLRLLEIIAGVDSEEDLAKLTDKEIEKVINAIDEVFSMALNFSARCKGIIKKIPILKNLVNEISDERILELAQETKTRIILNEQNISVGKQAVFEFTHREISSKMEKFLPKDRELTNEDYINAGRELFGKYTKNIDKLPPQKQKEQYEKLKQEFYLYLTKLNKDPEIAQNILAAAIAELEACDRLSAVQDFMKTCTYNKPLRARSAQRFAESNILTKDAFGNRMSAQDAVEYQFTTFSNMDDNGIRESLDELNNRAGEVEAEYRALLEKKASGTLSAEEAEKLAELEAVHQLYLVTGYSGGITGISVNSKITNASAEEYINQINADTARHGIQNEVAESVATFMSAHPEITQNQERDIKSLIDKAISNKFSQTLTQEKSSDNKQNVSNTQECKNEVNREHSSTAYQNKETSEKESLTSNNEHKFKNEGLALTNPFEKTHPFILSGRASKSETPANSSTNSEEKITGLTNITRALIKVIKLGLNCIKKFAKENNLNDKDVSVGILNNSESDRYEINYALDLFDRFTDSTQEMIFKHRLKNSDNKIAAAELMQTEQLENVDEESNSYVRNSIFNIIEEKEKA